MRKLEIEMQINPPKSCVSIESNIRSDKFDFKVPLPLNVKNPKIDILDNFTMNEFFEKPSKEASKKLVRKVFRKTPTE